MQRKAATFMNGRETVENANGKHPYHVVSFSGGKDSTALLLRMLELGMPVDEIVFCDTSVEFPQMYEHLKQVEQYTGRKITHLSARYSFEELLLDYEPRSRKGARHVHGLSFPSARVRWCTRWLKADVIDHYVKNLRGYCTPVQYVGIASDEAWRAKNKEYPLIRWGWTEADCLAYCRKKGFAWGGLYDIFSRVSCWCCPLQSLEELRMLRKNFPDLWNRLLAWQERTWRTFKPNFSAQELEERFQLEEERKRQGLSVNGRCKEFRLALRDRLRKKRVEMSV